MSASAKHIPVASHLCVVALLASPSSSKHNFPGGANEEGSEKLLSALVSIDPFGFDSFVDYLPCSLFLFTPSPIFGLNGKSVRSGGLY